MYLPADPNLQGASGPWRSNGASGQHTAVWHVCGAGNCMGLLSYAKLCYAILCYAMLCYAMLRCTVLCCAMLCCAMLCCAMLLQHTTIYHAILRLTGWLAGTGMEQVRPGFIVLTLALAPIVALM